MPGPEASNRERLLRLIDGGAEALKEFEHASDPRPAAPALRLDAWKARFRVSKPVLLRLAQVVFLGAVLLLGLRHGIGLLKAASRTLDVVPVAATREDGAGTGLRLVGVDSSQPAVALLEDIQSGKTYFAKVNEQVKGVRVKQILKNRVLVSVRGRTVELS